MFDGISFQSDFVQTGLLVAGVIIVVFVASRLAIRIAKRFVSDPAKAYHTTRLIRRIATLVGIILIIGIFSPQLGDFLTVLTVIGAGIAIAMRDALLSIAGWFHIATMTPYKQGDRIEINGIAGDVVDIRLMKTSIMEIRNWVAADQSTGRIVHFPNSWVFIHSIHNFSRGFNFIWNEIPLVLTFRSDWEAAREIMLEFAQESSRVVEHQASNEIHQLSREYLIHYSILTPFVYVNVMENGVKLTLRYLCEVRKRRGTEHALAISILDAFRRHPQIEFAYPMVGMTKIEGPQFGDNTDTLTKDGGGEDASQ